MRKIWMMGVVLLAFWVARGTAEETKVHPPYKGKGVGPVDTLVLADTINPEMAKKGAEIFKLKCSACHALDKRVVGPPLDGVTQRVRPEWIMNMILNPQEMLQKDSLAQALLGQYYVPMTPQNLTREEARAVLEFFRQNDAEKTPKNAD